MTCATTSRARTSCSAGTVRRAAIKLSALAALAAGCASGAPATPPDRPLFRLATAGIAQRAASLDDEPEDAWTGPPVEAFEAVFRFVRADGAAILAPRLVVLPGQRANLTVSNPVSYVQDFDVEQDDDVWVADPIIGVISDGWSTDLRFVEVPGAPEDVALAFRIRASGTRRPIAARNIGRLLAVGGGDVTIQLPRVEVAEATGARCVRLGEDLEIARIPEPGSGGEVSLRATVRRVTVPGPAEGEAAPSQPGADDEEPDDAALRTLAESAAAGTPTRRLRVAAVRLPPGVEADDVDAAGAERLATLAVESVAGAGVAVRNQLLESYVGGWEKKSRGVVDPVIGTLTSGLSADVREDGRLALSWRTTPAWKRFTTTGAGPGHHVPVDVPDSNLFEQVVDLAPGRTVHPVFRLPDGGTAAVVVEYREY